MSRGDRNDNIRWEAGVVKRTVIKQKKWVFNCVKLSKCGRGDNTVIKHVTARGIVPKTAVDGDTAWREALVCAHLEVTRRGRLVLRVRRPTSTWAQLLKIAQVQSMAKCWWGGGVASSATISTATTTDTAGSCCSCASSWTGGRGVRRVSLVVIIMMTTTTSSRGDVLVTVRCLLVVAEGVILQCSLPPVWSVAQFRKPNILIHTHTRTRWLHFRCEISKSNKKTYFSRFWCCLKGVQGDYLLKTIQTHENKTVFQVC